MQFNLTFNKPAARMFFAEGATAIKVKVGGEGKVLFKASDKEGGKDVFPISSRTRGGVGITVGGRFADAFLQATKMDRGVHMALAGASYKWIAGNAVEGKPSKIVPTARLWRAVDETVAKADDAPKRTARSTTKATPVAKAAPAAPNATGKRGTAGKAKAKTNREDDRKQSEPQAAVVHV